MIYITGDIHGNPVRLSTDSFYEQKEMKNQDENFVIILGDFGLVWNYEKETPNEKYWLNWLENKPFTTLFVDGNHENFNRLYSYPVKEWHGGKVHEIRPHVLHLSRGEVFTIEAKKFFAFGGASSHDISDGILDGNNLNWKREAKRLELEGKYMYRIKGLSWWEQELPTQEEMQIGIDNLKLHNNKVDFILSHSPSTSELYLMGGKGLYKTDILTNYLEEVKATTEYKKHLFGHMHINKAINDKDICLYEQITRIN
jgi:hypothetical protein